MSDRIVDEAFVAELAENRGASADERFNHVQELILSGDAEDLSNILSSLLEVIREQTSRISALEERLFHVYIKSGESLAQLKNDLGSISSDSQPESDSFLKVKEELKNFRGDLYARSDLQIKHLEDRVDALEHDVLRGLKSKEMQINDLSEKIERMLLDIRTERT